MRPAVRAMRGYTPGEQIPDAVKLNTNEGAFPPSPRVMAALAGIADESLRLYPDPTGAPPARGGGRAVRCHARAGAGRERIRRLPDHPLPRLPRRGRARRLPVADLRPLRQLAHDAGGASWCGAVPADGRRWELPDELASQRAKMIILANPNNPSATLVPVDELRKLATPRRVDRRHRRGLRRLRAGAGIDASMLPYLDSTRT